MITGESLARSPRISTPKWYENTPPSISSRKAYGKYADHLKHDWAMLGFLTEPTLIDQVNEYGEVGEFILASEREVRKIYHGASAVDMDTKLPSSMQSPSVVNVPSLETRPQPVAAQVVPPAPDSYTV